MKFLAAWVVIVFLYCAAWSFGSKGENYPQSCYYLKLVQCPPDSDEEICTKEGRQVVNSAEEYGKLVDSMRGSAAMMDCHGPNNLPQVSKAK